MDRLPDGSDALTVFSGIWGIPFTIPEPGTQDDEEVERNIHTRLLAAP
jgi:hypothetical protein